MNTRWLMIGSAVVLAALGLVASFVPREILLRLGSQGAPLETLLVQITGALYLGFAMFNWMARESLLGGIYGRPVVFGNFMHFMVAAFALLKALIAGPRPPVLIAAASLYWVFCLAFGWVSFTPPREVAPAVKPG
jgi:hypothetical protein